MIAAVACVPQTPLLLPGLTGRLVAEVGELRAAAARAVACLLDQELDELVVVGAAPRTAVYPVDAPDPAGRLAPSPHRSPARDALPVPLAVGRSLLTGRTPPKDPRHLSPPAPASPQEPGPVVPWRLQGVAADAAPDRCLELGRRLAGGPARSGLLVIADGSARRGEKAPGYVDPRAAVLDAEIATALGTANLPRLRALDPGTCDALLVAGRPAWQVMAGACDDTRWHPRTLYEDDPFGVAYWVITWLPGSHTASVEPPHAVQP
ncbi:hypothetical protein [Nonomuraea sp. NPDC002799]